MSNNKAIEIILRIRPVPNRYQGIKVDQQNNEFIINTPKDESQGYINNQKQVTKFKFDKIFDMDVKQQKIFDKVAKEVVEAAVDGYNGTIFAYGQTGSGKTYTMTGGDTEDGQGIIPRTLMYIFYLAETKGVQIKVKIRYMQIYNGIGYDLLDPTIDPDMHDKVKMLQDLQKVRPLQTGNGDLKLQNLSIHLAKSQQDAMDILFIGDNNRITCSTLKNDQSTRSHCIFMINLETTRPGSQVKSVATINLVDLSGSQKLKDTNYKQRVEKEAININLGLHYLERLIVELNKKMNGENVHVPYRQSLMNLVLRDSIGGNCITRMVATVSPKQQDLLQSISTCRFAQRVALIKNNIQRNQTVDPAIIIARLKRENAQLKAELALLKGEDVKEELDKWQIQECQKACQDYLESDDPSASLIMNDRLKINQCFYFFKTLIKKGGKPMSISMNGSQNKNASNLQMAKGKISSADEERYQDQIKKLKLALQSRDNQITLLLSLINKKRGGQTLQSLPVNRMKPQQEEMMRSVIKQKPIEFKQVDEAKQMQESKATQSTKIKRSNNWMSQADSSSVADKNAARSIIANRPIEVKQIENMLIKPLNLSNQDLLDEARAFEAFRVSSRKNEAFQKNAQVLKDKLKMGKEIALVVQQTREKVARLKDRLEQLQRQNAVKNLVDGVQIEDPEQAAIRQQMAKTKQVYRQSSQKLKGIKLEIQNIQILQKKNLQQMQKDFLKYIKFKQEQRQKTVAAVDTSLLASNVRDKEVQKHLQSFLKARQELRKR